MDSSTSQNNKRKNIVLSILAGIAYAVGVFLVGLPIFILIDMNLPEGSTIPMLTSLLLIGIIIGIFGGRKTYKRLFEKQ